LKNAKRSKREAIRVSYKAEEEEEESIEMEENEGRRKFASSRGNETQKVANIIENAVTFLVPLALCVSAKN